VSATISRVRLRWELAGSYAGLTLNALITLLLLPVYVSLLGAAEWGSVALCMTLQGLLFAADAALAPPLLRDVASAAAQGRQVAVYRRYLKLYGAIALGLFSLGQLILLLLPLLGVLPSDAPLWPLRLVLMQFLFQFCNNAAIGYWNGVLQQRRANLRLAVALLIKHACALALLLCWRADALAYLLPFAVVGAAEFVLNRRALLRASPEVPRSVAVAAREIDVGPYAAAAVLGLMGGQIDRIVLSLYLPAVDYGRYFLASTVVLSLLQLQQPLLRSFLPRLATADPWQPWLWAMLRASLLLVALPSVLLSLVAQPLVRLWLRDAGAAEAVAPLLGLMLPAVALLAAYAPFGALLLGQRRYRLLTRINAVALLAQLLVLAVATSALGAYAGGLAWLACALTQLAVVPLILRRRESA
jgi:O-antigen/teichoic acid export membrane protein